MKTLTFAGPGDGPHLLITAGVHGDEFEPMYAVQRLASLFQQSHTSVAGFRGRVTLVPCVNEAAFLRGHRCAEDGLDLARCCPGDSAGSVTERTAHALNELIRTADFYIDLHTGGTEFSLYPLAGYMLVSDPRILADQRRMARAFDLPVVWGTSGELDGRSLSVARDAGVPAIYCEYHGAATCDPEGVRAYVNGCLQVAAEIGVCNAPVNVSRVRHVVEDDRPASGHLQVCHPSPLTGLFQPSVRLGDDIHRGDVLGLVHSIDGKQQAEIAADRSGIVLMLRTFPRVRAGETVGVVLESGGEDGTGNLPLS